MNIVLLLLKLGSAFFAVLFVGYYLRILYRAREAGPEPPTWILLAVGVSLIASYAVIETFLFFEPERVIFNIQRVYFMLGNVILFGIFYRLWRGLGDRRG